MTVLAFTGVQSKIKDQIKEANDAGFQVFGFPLFDDTKGEPVDIPESNASMHVFYAIKRSRIEVIAFQSVAEARSFFEKIEQQFGKETADGYLKGLKYAAVGDDTSTVVSDRGFETSFKAGSFTELLKTIN